MDSPGPQSKSKAGKTRRNWTVPRKYGPSKSYEHEIRPGDSGIWVSTERGKEARCVTELRNIFQKFAETLPDNTNSHEPNDNTHNGSIDTELANELEELRSTKSRSFQSIKLSDPSLIFFKTIAPVEPVKFTHAFCQSLANNELANSAHAALRLTPIQLFGKATENGVKELAKTVLQPYFDKGPEKKTFAIRVNFRNHTVLKRDEVIKLVASQIDPEHRADLKDYDLLLLVEVYKSICGISVVDQDYDRLLKYNLAALSAKSQEDSDQVKDRQD